MRADGHPLERAGQRVDWWPMLVAALGSSLASQPTLCSLLPTGKLFFPGPSTRYRMGCFLSSVSLSFAFEAASFAQSLKAQPSCGNHSAYILQAQQNSLLSALHRAAKCIQQYVRVNQRAATQANRLEQKCCRETHYVFFFSLSCFYSDIALLTHDND